jgi:hypothetical protein
MNDIIDEYNRIREVNIEILRKSTTTALSSEEQEIYKNNNNQLKAKCKEIGIRYNEAEIPPKCNKLTNEQVQKMIDSSNKLEFIAPR